MALTARPDVSIIKTGDIEFQKTHLIGLGHRVNPTFTNQRDLLENKRNKLMKENDMSYLNSKPD